MDGSGVSYGKTLPQLTIRVLLGRDLEQSGEGGLVSVDGGAYPVSDLRVSSCCRGQLTCWLISRIAMSFLSSVYSWNAASIAPVCVSALLAVASHGASSSRVKVTGRNGPDSS